MANVPKLQSLRELIVSGNRIIADCESIIEAGRNYLGGKVTYLDCRQPLISYYQKYGFNLVSETASESGLYKMFKVLSKLVWS
jgi:predicted GNAT family N-acyltransferase